MGPRPTTLTPEVAAKYRQVVTMRANGATFEAIADRVGYAGRQGAYDAYRAALKWWGKDGVEEARQLESERLDRLHASTTAMLQAAEREAVEVRYNADGTEERTITFAPDVLSAVNTAVNISRRRSSLLGLDAPRQVEVAGADGGPVVTDIGELLRERMEAVNPGSTVTTTSNTMAPQNGLHSEQGDD